jgi:AcrR family transcriptional regulator
MGDPATDGRSLRRQRTEQAAVDAILDLLNEGVVQPTAQEVSDRSGVSMRSIFRLFQDMEALHAAAIERQLARVGPLLADVPATGPVTDRIAALTDDRARFFEAVAPVRRLAVRRSAQSPALRSGLARGDRHFRSQVATVFAAELATAPDDDLLDALDAATSWEAWDRLRRAQDLSVAAARRVTALTLTALLAGTARPADDQAGDRTDDHDDHDREP